MIFFENVILVEVFFILENIGYCCVLILDVMGIFFWGNIYKMYFYCYKLCGGDMFLLVMMLFKNVIKFILKDVVFYNVFFIICDLLYIVVLDENNCFYGILIYNWFL